MIRRTIVGITYFVAALVFYLLLIGNVDSHSDIGQKVFEIKSDAQLYTVKLFGEKLSVNPVENSSGALVSYSEKSKTITFYLDDLLDLDNSCIYRDLPGEEQEKLNSQELLEFISSYSPSQSKVSLQKDIQTDGNGTEHRTITLEGEYSGSLVMYANHGENQCVIPIEYTNLRSEWFQPEELAIALGLAFVPAIVVYLLTRRKRS